MWILDDSLPKFHACTQTLTFSMKCMSVKALSSVACGVTMVTRAQASWQHFIYRKHVEGQLRQEETDLEVKSIDWQTEVASVIQLELSFYQMTQSELMQCSHTGWQILQIAFVARHVATFSLSPECLFAWTQACCPTLCLIYCQQFWIPMTVIILQQMCLLIYWFCRWRHCIWCMWCPGNKTRSSMCWVKLIPLSFSLLQPNLRTCVGFSVHQVLTSVIKHSTMIRVKGRKAMTEGPDPGKPGIEHISTLQPGVGVRVNQCPIHICFGMERRENQVFRAFQNRHHGGRCRLEAKVDCTIREG